LVLMRIPIWEWVTDNITDSKVEQIKDTPKARKK